MICRESRKAMSPCKSGKTERLAAVRARQDKRKWKTHQVRTWSAAPSFSRWWPLPWCHGTSRFQGVTALEILSRLFDFIITSFVYILPGFYFPALPLSYQRRNNRNQRLILSDADASGETLRKKKKEQMSTQQDVEPRRHRVLNTGFSQSMAPNIWSNH